MASTKYPHQEIIFPWAKPEDSDSYPFILFINWRPGQLPTPTDVIEEATYWHTLIEDRVRRFLAVIDLPARVAIDIQGYGGEIIKTKVIQLKNVYWCGKIGESIPRLDYVSDDESQYSDWGPLLLAIAPVQPNTPLSTRTFSTESKQDKESSELLNILSCHGIIKDQ